MVSIIDKLSTICVMNLSNINTPPNCVFHIYINLKKNMNVLSNIHKYVHMPAVFKKGEGGA